MLRSFALAALALTAASVKAQTPSQDSTRVQRLVQETEEAGGRTTTEEARPYDELIATFQKDYLRVTTLIRVVPAVPFEDAEGNQARFDVAAAWLGIAGRLGGNVGYFVRGAFERTPTVLEAYVSYGSDDVRAIVGKQMVPFSAEFLIGAPNTDFVNRSRAVRALVPGRSVGAAARADLGGTTLRGGVFNATIAPGVTQAQRGGFALAARAQRTAELDGGALQLGANVAYDTEDFSERDAVEIGDRLIVGADARLRLGAFLLAGEYLYQDETGPGIAPRQEGGYATVGYDLSPDDRVLVRLDSFGDSREGLVGYNRTFTPAASFQANLIVPFDDAAEPLQAVLNFQLFF